MIKVIMTIALGLLTGVARPQSILDLTEQLAIDTEKLASLKSTLQEMYQGYADLQKGYTRIRDIAKGSFNLHAAYLDGLLILSPAVKDDQRIAAIIHNEVLLVQGCQTASRQATGTPLFTAAELDYIIGLYAALLDRSMQSVEELTLVITDNQLRMSDAQRIQAIDRIDGEVEGQLAFLQELNSTLAIQTLQRRKAAQEIQTLKALYGLPN